MAATLESIRDGRAAPSRKVEVPPGEALVERRVMNVLYATDGREAARDAGRLLERLASPTEANVTVFSVDELADRVVADGVADATFGWAMEHLEASSVSARAKRAEGDVKSEIGREIEAAAYDLVVMGLGNTGWLGGLIMGGAANHVLYRSSIPTMVVNHAPAAGRERIRVVIGTDGSAASDRSIETLIAMTEPDRCDISVVSVVQRLPIETFGPPVSGTIRRPGELHLAMERGEEDAAVNVRAALERLERAAFRCTGEVVTMPGTASGLADAMDQHQADLVVVGSRGFGPLVGVALGSVSSHMVRAAPATLVAPPA
jgi:nucleotide-binding universal stress UspA family protein